MNTRPDVTAPAADPLAVEGLVATAREMANRAYCPYSGYAVGAALLATDGRRFGGCNVENASYGLTLCAERVALATAVAAGAREFSALALAAGVTEPATPCGACLQVLSEFCPPDMPVYLVRLHPEAPDLRTWTLAELLPKAFLLHT